MLLPTFYATTFPLVPAGLVQPRYGGSQADMHVTTLPSRYPAQAHYYICSAVRDRVSSNGGFKDRGRISNVDGAFEGVCWQMMDGGWLCFSLAAAVAEIYQYCCRSHL